MKSQLRLRERILLGYAVPLALSLVVATVVYFNARTVEQTTVGTQNANQVVTLIKDGEFLSIIVQRLARGYFLTQSEQAFPAMDKAEKDFSEVLDNLRRRVSDSQQREMIPRLEEAAKKVIAYARLMMQLEKSGNHAQVIENLKLGEADRLHAAYVELAKAFERREVEILEARSKEQEAALLSMTRTVWGASLLSAILSAIIGILIAGRISANISAAVAKLSSSSAQIAATITEQERTVSQQSAMVAETTATITELDNTARQTAEQANVMAESAQQSYQLTGEGKQAVQRTLAGMSEVKGKVESLAQQILQLSEQVGQIDNIVKVVRELASETNILALNAAVEAAHAGEHGKGFAVVASEVRKLADQSKKSAEQANQIISEIQKANNSAILMTEHGTRTVSEVSELANRLGEMFDTLSATSSQNLEKSQQVQLNARQQSVAISNVTTAVSAINAGSQEVVAGISQSKQGVQSVHETAQSLHGLI